MQFVACSSGLGYELPTKCQTIGCLAAEDAHGGAIATSAEMSKKSWKRWRCAERCHLCHISPGLPRYEINKIAMDASKFDERVPVSCSRNKYGLVLMMTQLENSRQKEMGCRVADSFFPRCLLFKKRHASRLGLQRI